MTTDTQAAQAELGRARLRKEDARLVTGQTNWTDNIVLPGMLHMAFVRSPIAHARITSVDLSAARAMPGVIAAFSGADFAEEQGSLPCAWPVTEDIVIPAHPPMATEEVRYVGEAVAVVVARDRYDGGGRGRPWWTSATSRCPRCSTCGRRSTRARRRCTRRATRASSGPSPRATWTRPFRDAPVVIERTYRQQRLIPSAMEPRAVVATCVAGSSPSGRPPRSRTSCGSCWPWSPGSPSRTSG